MFRRRRWRGWLVEEKMGGGECLGEEMEEMGGGGGDRWRRVFRRRTWRGMVVEEEMGGGGGGEKIGGGECLGGGDG